MGRLFETFSDVGHLFGTFSDIGRLLGTFSDGTFESGTFKVVGPWLSGTFSDGTFCTVCVPYNFCFWQTGKNDDEILPTYVRNF
jgi:hypothetical protein